MTEYISDAIHRTIRRTADCRIGQNPSRFLLPKKPTSDHGTTRVRGLSEKENEYCIKCLWPQRSAADGERRNAVKLTQAVPRRCAGPSCPAAATFGLRFLGQVWRKGSSELDRAWKRHFTLSMRSTWSFSDRRRKRRKFGTYLIAIVIRATRFNQVCVADGASIDFPVQAGRESIAERETSI
jgi:hypothetical protein